MPYGLCIFCTVKVHVLNSPFHLPLTERLQFFLIVHFIISFRRRILLTYLLTDLPTYLLTYFLAYLLAYLLPYLLTCLFTYLLTYLLTYSLTHSLHGAESFLRS